MWVLLVIIEWKLTGLHYLYVSMATGSVKFGDRWCLFSKPGGILQCRIGHSRINVIHRSGATQRWVKIQRKYWIYLCVCVSWEVIAFEGQKSNVLIIAHFSLFRIGSLLVSLVGSKGGLLGSYKPLFLNIIHTSTTRVTFTDRDQLRLGYI